jgi:hypothetical protein
MAAQKMVMFLFQSLNNRGLIMTITKNYNGSVTISDIKDNQYYNQTYYFYSLREAKKLFKQYIKGVNYENIN